MCEHSIAPYGIEVFVEPPLELLAQRVVCDF